MVCTSVEDEPADTLVLVTLLMLNGELERVLVLELKLLGTVVVDVEPYCGGAGAEDVDI